MNPLEYRPKRSRLALLALGALFFAAVGAALVRWPQEFTHSHGLVVPAWSIVALGVVSVLFALAGSVAMMRQFFDDRPRLVLDDDGLFDRTLGTPKIPWSSIAAAEIVAISRTKFIALRLHDENARLQAMPPWKRRATAGNVALGFGRFNVNLSALAPSAEQVFAEMNLRWENDRVRRESQNARFRS